MDNKVILRNVAEIITEQMIKYCINCETKFEAIKDRAKFCSDLCRATFNQNRNRRNGKIAVKIYQLINPIDNNIFYVGKTINSLKNRLTAHLNDGINKEKTKVIKSIKDAGLSPLIQELEVIECSNDDEELIALERESYWVNTIKDNGNKLCNGELPKSQHKLRLSHEYLKVATKTAPMTIRLDTDKFEFVKTREKLSTAQQVSDFLLNKYWWEWKVPVATHKESPPLELKTNQNESVSIELSDDVKYFMEKMQSDVDFKNRFRSHRLKPKQETIIQPIQQAQELSQQDKKRINMLKGVLIMHPIKIEGKSIFSKQNDDWIEVEDDGSGLYQMKNHKYTFEEINQCLISIK